MKVHRDPNCWPKQGLLPALLLRLERKHVETRIGERLYEFNDEGEPCAGIAFTLDDRTAVAVLMRIRTEATPSIYLSSNTQEDASKVSEVLNFLRISQNEVVDVSSGFSQADLLRGNYIVASDADKN